MEVLARNFRNNDLDHKHARPNITFIIRWQRKCVG